MLDKMPKMPPTIKWDQCPSCKMQRVVRLPADWQRQVTEERAAIETVGCGSPWHYSLSGMDRPDLTAQTLAAALSVVSNVHGGPCQPSGPCAFCRQDAVKAYAAGVMVRLGEQPHPVPYPACVEAGCVLHPWVL